MRTVRFFLSLVLLVGFANAQTSTKMSPFERSMYDGVQNIEYFGLVHCHVKGEPRPAIGCTDEELTDYLKLRFRNNFGSVPISTVDYSKPYDEKKVGYLWIGVWIVGESYPVAYHVEGKFGTFHRLEIIHDEFLGYGNLANTESKIKAAIDHIVAGFATKYFKLKGEF